MTSAVRSLMDDVLEVTGDLKQHKQNSTALRSTGTSFMLHILQIRWPRCTYAHDPDL